MCDLSHRKNDVLTLSNTLLNLCNRGGMKSSKMSKGGPHQKRLGTTVLTSAFIIISVFVNKWMILTYKDVEA